MHLATNEDIRELCNKIGRLEYNSLFNFLTTKFGMIDSKYDIKFHHPPNINVIWTCEVDNKKYNFTLNMFKNFWQNITKFEINRSEAWLEWIFRANAQHVETSDIKLANGQIQCNPVFLKLLHDGIYQILNSKEHYFIYKDKNWCNIKYDSHTNKTQDLTNGKTYTWDCNRHYWYNNH